MADPAEFIIEPTLYLRDGRIIETIADAIAYLREQEARPGVDTRDDVLHRLERAGNDEAGQRAVVYQVASISLHDTNRRARSIVFRVMHDGCPARLSGDRRRSGRVDGRDLSRPIPPILRDRGRRQQPRAAH